MWIAAVSLLLSLVAAALCERAPKWLQPITELIAGAILFAFVCLLESGESSNARSRSAA